jgi:molybdopterin-biosynthesis enzyme MoeA-like protein
MIIVGDEILSGKRTDKHLGHLIELLRQRGLNLAYAHYVGDDPVRITDLLKRAFDSGDVVFSTGGIGATPDDHTRQCAAAALGVDLHMHDQAKALILERMQELAQAQGRAYDPTKEDDAHRLNMAVFPMGAQIIPNPYNKIAGFSCKGVGQGSVHFVPGFPVMAWPMMEWVLDTYYAHWFNRESFVERSVIVKGAMEATLTPLMLRIEAEHPRVKVFSLPSVDHPVHGRHIELGVKGKADDVAPAYAFQLTQLRLMGAKLGPEINR